MEGVIKRKISIPEYFKKYIDSNIDLNETSKICCPFHKELTPSFSYSSDRGVWRCFGSCKIGGDVITLHQKSYRLDTREEAIKSLCGILNIPYKQVTDLNQLSQIVKVDKEKVNLERVYNLCKLHANTVQRWLQLDYVMSINPTDYFRLIALLNEWEVSYDN